MKTPKMKDAKNRLERGYYEAAPVKAKEHGGAGTGGMVAVPKGMQPPAKTPCAECPARRDALAGYLGGYTPEMYLEILHSKASVGCHCSKGFHDGVIETQRHCTGVIAYRANVGYLPRPSEVPTGADDAVTNWRETVSQEESKEVFFSNPNEFLLHHRRGQ